MTVLGRRGGKVNSAAKAAAVRENGKKGRRPPKINACQVRLRTKKDEEAFADIVAAATRHMKTLRWNPWPRS